MKELLCVKDLIAGYDKPAAKDINFSLEEGKIFTLMGPNGSGKSTILRTVSGELKRHGGDVLIEGVSIDKIPLKERAKFMAVLFTGYSKTELMTCREVIETGRYPYTGHLGILTKKDRQAVDRAVELIGTEDILDKDFSAISDGQRQRVMLARAVCQEPKVLILDEPTSYLDIHYKISFLETLRNLVDKEGMSALISMHEPELAENISDNIIGIKNGCIFSEWQSGRGFKKDMVSSLFDVDSKEYTKYFGR